VDFGSCGDLQVAFANTGFWGINAFFPIRTSENHMAVTTERNGALGFWVWGLGFVFHGAGSTIVGIQATEA
jgi:hypothetical protein